MALNHGNIVVINPGTTMTITYFDLETTRLGRQAGRVLHRIEKLVEDMGNRMGGSLLKLLRVSEYASKKKASSKKKAHIWGTEWLVRYCNTSPFTIELKVEFEDIFNALAKKCPKTHRTKKVAS